ncbi:MAG: hypothetical protein QM523_01305 [Candidatus Pacebacteria bacterium]|nr:hypothetical protein [Candidatus Paceibacterota bacterium]
MPINERESQALKNSGLLIVNESNPYGDAIRQRRRFEFAKLSKNSPANQVTDKQIEDYFDGGKRDIKTVPAFINSKNLT